MEIEPISREQLSDRARHGRNAAPAAAPLVLSFGLMLLAAGAVSSMAFMLVGCGLCLVGLGLWIQNLLPGRGHIHEPLIAHALRPAQSPVRQEPWNTFESGAPGYRMRLPEQVHPISAGVKGGIVGGFVMPLPALAYGALSGHGIWYPVNLLVGMVLPGMDEMTTQQLEQFQLWASGRVAVVIHAVMAIVLGMIYGVLMPTLPDIPKPLAWGALLAPMMWTGVSFLLMGAVNPVLRQRVEWPWFIASQFIFGVILALVVMRPMASIRCGPDFSRADLGGLLMPLPAILWGHFSGYGIWYPVDLLAGMVTRDMGAVARRRVDEVPLQLAAGGIDHSCDDGTRHRCRFWDSLATIAADSRAARLGSNAVAARLDLYKLCHDGRR